MKNQVKNQVNNNKGYSLVELVITIAIFSIIMVAIILMMRTTLVSYREGLFETSLQEEAQIVANQVADLLIDASNVTGSAGNYSISTPEGVVSLKQNGKELLVNGVTLSDQLKAGSFVIDGLDPRNAGDKKTAHDNTAIVKLSFEYRGNTYEASKEVYFRNNVEDRVSDVAFSPFDISDKTNPNPGGGSGLETCEIKRYEDVDISALYDIVSGGKLSDACNTTKFFVRTVKTNEMIKNPAEGVTYERYIVSVDPTRNTQFGDSTLKTSDPEAYYFEGYTSSGEYKKVILKLLEVNPKQGNPIFEHYGEGVNIKDTGLNGQGYPTVIQVDGLNVNSMLADHKDISYTITIDGKKSDSTKVKAESGLVYPGGGNFAAVPVEGEPVQYSIGLMTDPITGGFLLTPNSGQFPSQKSYVNKLNETDMVVEIDFGDSNIKTLNYQFYVGGNSLENAY